MKETRKWIVRALTLALLLLVVPAGALAQAESDYVVQSGDWLAKIAARQYGDWKLYPAIVLATNAASIASATAGYATVSDPFLIEPGWVLRIPSLEDAQNGLTVGALQNAEYQSQWTASGTAPLADGEYSEAAAPGSATKTMVKLHERMAFGYTGDGKPFAAVILITDPGGSGTFYDLAAVIDRDSVPVHIATTQLGDRVRVESLAVEGSEMVVQMVVQGPDDPMCCPTQRVRVRYALQQDQLVEIAHEVIAQEIVGVTWEWEKFVGGDDSVLEVNDPTRYTLLLQPDGTLNLRVDCNRASGTHTLDGSHLTLEVGPMTRAACPEDSLDDEFLEELSSVRTYVMDEGKLVLNLWADAGNMIFRKGAGQ